ncbi:protein of unknown function [Xenorhabdus bovienii]|uniref:Uncharacterized protein n=1 Tax=Xenorhabdus bovienii TaxID=40576 RepID=A0A0B6X920_XENBV|nr:protein of unknown function [Xenorhabdus bovienii]
MVKRFSFLPSSRYVKTQLTPPTLDAFALNPAPSAKNSILSLSLPCKILSFLSLSLFSSVVMITQNIYTNVYTNVYTQCAARTKKRQQTLEQYTYKKSVNDLILN